MMALIQGDTELGEIIMRTFILRRVELLAAGVEDVVLIGSIHSPGTFRIKEFLMRNGHPTPISILNEMQMYKTSWIISILMPARYCFDLSRQLSLKIYLLIKLQSVLEKRGLNPANVEWFTNAVEREVMKIRQLQDDC